MPQGTAFEEATRKFVTGREGFRQLFVDLMDEIRRMHCCIRRTWHVLTRTKAGLCVMAPKPGTCEEKRTHGIAPSYRARADSSADGSRWGFHCWEGRGMTKSCSRWPLLTSGKRIIAVHHLPLNSEDSPERRVMRWRASLCGQRRRSSDERLADKSRWRVCGRRLSPSCQLGHSQGAGNFLVKRDWSTTRSRPTW